MASGERETRFVAGKIEMLDLNRQAFKEWSVVCAALGSGKQSLILRKGGVEDGAEGIRIEKPEFWLYPTYLHQGEQSVREGEVGSSPSKSDPPKSEKVRIQYYAVVERAEFIATEVALARLQKFHIWTSSTIVQRFHYRTPGLWSMIVRIYGLERPYEVPQSAEMAGCRTWVELPEAISTAGLKPVLGDPEFLEVRQEIEEMLKG